jgi:hypothetical protein
MKLLSAIAMLRTASTFDKVVQTETDPMVIDALVQNFRGSQKEREEGEEEEENDIVLEEQKCRVKTYQDSVKS